LEAVLQSQTNAKARFQPTGIAEVKASSRSFCSRQDAMTAKAAMIGHIFGEKRSKKPKLWGHGVIRVVFLRPSDVCEKQLVKTSNLNR